MVPISTFCLLIRGSDLLVVSVWKHNSNQRYHINPSPSSTAHSSPNYPSSTLSLTFKPRQKIPYQRKTARSINYITQLAYMDRKDKDTKMKGGLSAGERDESVTKEIWREGMGKRLGGEGTLERDRKDFWEVDKTMRIKVRKGNDGVDEKR